VDARHKAGHDEEEISDMSAIYITEADVARLVTTEDQR